MSTTNNKNATHTVYAGVYEIPQDDFAKNTIRDTTESLSGYDEIYMFSFFALSSSLKEVTDFYENMRGSETFLGGHNRDIYGISTIQRFDYTENDREMIEEAVKLTEMPDMDEYEELEAQEDFVSRLYGKPDEMSDNDKAFAYEVLSRCIKPSKIWVNRVFAEWALHDSIRESSCWQDEDGNAKTETELLQNGIYKRPVRLARLIKRDAYRGTLGREKGTEEGPEAAK